MPALPHPPLYAAASQQEGLEGHTAPRGEGLPCMQLRVTNYCAGVLLATAAGSRRRAGRGGRNTHLGPFLVHNNQRGGGGRFTKGQQRFPYPKCALQRKHGCASDNTGARFCRQRAPHPHGHGCTGRWGISLQGGP
jgi:hypothetical protein